METENTNKKSHFWKSVLIGGVPGILMGSAGTMLASNVVTPVEPEPLVDPVEPVTPLEDIDVPVAVVSDDQSFAQAFADARQQVGPGGVFVWHGNIYNTYSAEEWAAMSQEERDHFVAQSLDSDFEIPVVEPENETVTQVDPVTPVEPAKPEQVSHEGPEVIFLGAETVTAEDGTEMTIEHYEVDGHAALIADVDGDIVPDVYAVDENDNMVIDDMEIHSIAPEEHYAVNGGDDMPDYINDADTSAFV